MSPEFYLRTALEPALGLLPPRMDSVAARAMVIAICLQESRLEHRRQIGGPARSYGQFEQGGGVRGVLTHLATRGHIRTVLAALDYAADSDAEACWIAIEHNDILGAAFSRLNLWWLPGALPGRDDWPMAWSQYLTAWKPGKPHKDTFQAFYDRAWAVVDGL